MADITNKEERTPVSRASRQRMLRWALVLIGAIVLLGAGWWGWQRWRSPAPVPPEVSLPDADPELAEALAAARGQIEREPRSAAAWGRLGKLLRAAHALEPAARMFAQAAKLDPGNPRWPYLHGEALSQSQPEAALTPLRQAVELCTRQDADLLAPRLRLAEALLAAGRQDDAKTQLRLAQEKEPEHPSIHLNLGLLAFAQGDLAASRDHLLRCQHSPFTRHKALAQLAAVCQRMGDGAAARKFSVRAAAASPDVHWGDPWVMECLQQGVGRSSRFRYIEQLEAQGRMAEAVQALREITERRPDQHALIGLGQNLLQIGDLDGAQDALQQVMHMVPDGFQAYYLQSKVEWARGEARRKNSADDSRRHYQKAADFARQAIAKKPSYAPAHVTLGLCLRQLGQSEAAMASWRAAVAHGPEVMEGWLHLGEALAEARQMDEARRCLEQAALLAGADDSRVQAAQARWLTPSK